LGSFPSNLEYFPFKP